jgi:hypothetical protein
VLPNIKEREDKNREKAAKIFNAYILYPEKIYNVGFLVKSRMDG